MGMCKIMNQQHLNLDLPAELYERLRQAAQENGRSVESLIVDLLHWSYTEPGIAVEQQEDGRLAWFAIHPRTGERVEIDPEQRWYWTAEWQAKEREVDEDLKAGRYEDFDNIDDFFDAL